jgi:hypothetical protein
MMRVNWLGNTDSQVWLATALRYLRAVKNAQNHVTGWVRPDENFGERRAVHAPDIRTLVSRVFS